MKAPPWKKTPADMARSFRFKILEEHVDAIMEEVHKIMGVASWPKTYSNLDDDIIAINFTLSVGFDTEEIYKKVRRLTRGKPRFILESEVIW